MENFTDQGGRLLMKKRIISIILVLAMLLSLIPILAFMKASAATTQTVKLYFKNTDGWSKVYGYVWDSKGNPQMGSWPGTALSADSNGLYVLEVNYTTGTGLNFIFNNNGGSQTGDLSISDTKLASCQSWWVAGASGSPTKYALPVSSNGKVTFTYEGSASTVKLAGSMNGWSGVSMSKSGSAFTYTYELAPGKYEYKFIADGNWINDPCNPRTTGNDNNNYVIVPGMTGTTVAVSKGVSCALPAELSYVDENGDSTFTAVTYSSSSSYVTINGNNVTVASGFTGSTIDLTATNANGDTCTVTLSIGTAAGTDVTIHFINSTGWNGVAAHSWVTQNGSSAGLTTWPGTTVTRDGDGMFTYQLNHIFSSGQGLGLLFHNNNGAQTADITISAADIAKGSVELWVQPSIKADDEGKHPVTVTTTKAAQFISVDTNGNQVTFRYKGSGTNVYLAGSFNNWSTSANKMTKSGGVFSTTITLEPGVYEYKFVVDNEWVTDPANALVGGYDGNSVAVIPDGEAPADDDKVTVVLHFYRESGYSGWDVWYWGSDTSGSSASFKTLAGDKGRIATFTVSGTKNQNVGYIIRKSDWSSQEFDYNRYIDLSDVTSGTVHYFVNSGEAEGDRVLYSDVTNGAKPLYAKLDYDTGKVWVKLSMPHSGALSTAFSVTGVSGLSVTGVSVSDGGVLLTLNRTISLSECAALSVVYNGLSCGVTTDNLFYSDKFAADYTYNGDDLGATWSASSTTFKVWAPTAKAVHVKLYKSGNYGANDQLQYVAMTAGDKGVWSVTISGDLHGVYYNYDVSFANYTVEATDPYADSTGANGDRGMIVDFSRVNPAGWDSDLSPNQGMNYTDAIIYEMHIREMTIDSSSGVKDAWKGKYLGLTQSGTTYNGRATALDHLKELGITHVQLMPAFDFNSADEYHLTDWQQYAWGYDPKNYNTPEGSYATDPFNGATRITEFKQMVQTFHANGINVVMDVVYNHAFDGGNFCYNKIVPNYFSRFYGEYWSNGSGVGNDIATERSMARNFIVDSIYHWVEEYHIDGFRFDLAGLIDTQTINEIVNTVHAKYPNVIFYGEGWGVGGTAVEEGYSLATKDNAWMTPGFSFFNDNFRNDIAGDNGHSCGFATGDWGKADAIGNYFRASNGWSTTPTQTINYVSCHDNYSLFDKIIISRNGAYYDEMVRMNNLSAATYMLAQGTPLIYSGEELLREKKDADGNRYDNAYGTDDYINKIRWSDLVNKTSCQTTDDYYAGLIAFRKNHAALRCPSGADAWNYTSYHKINDQCVMFYVNGYPNYECSEGIVIIYNASSSTQWVNIYDYGVPYGNWQACIHGDKAGTSALWSTSDGSVGVEGISTTVLVLGDLIHEESVYNNQKTSCAHTSHNTSGFCTACGKSVSHSFVSGKCACGLSEDAPTTVTVYYDNTSSNWSKVNAYAWTTTSGVTTEFAGNWPGSAMTNLGNGIFSIELPIGAKNIIFNNSADQTDDLTIPAYDSGTMMYSSGKWTAYKTACQHLWANATCTTPKVCPLCGATEGEALGHSYTNVVTAPTCTAEGYTTYTCSACGDSYVADQVAALGHSYVNGYCSVCGEKDPDYVE
ncbi:MAG: type I pullulanase, partial [Ruminococcaceae bacterium]|nr:type I pullulanase [Oscillospiraceae bacterium]